MMKKLSTKKRIALICVILLSVAALGVGAQQLISIYSQEELLLPPIPQHADVARQPRLSFAQSLTTKFPSDMGSLPKSHCAAQPKDWLAQENQNPGVSMDAKKWHNLHLFIPTGSVLWTNQLSATCGDVIKVHASLFGGSKDDNALRRIHVMRIGYYNGSGARSMWSSPLLTLKSYNVPRVKSLTRMVETKWPVTTSFSIGSDWTPGLYVVASENENGTIENVTPLIVNGAPATSKLLLVHSTMTWTAYNGFGGRSAYMGPVDAKRERSRVVSMDRPMLGSGINHFDRDAIALVQFLEERGIEVDQIADTDIDRYPSLLSHYNGVIFSGHAEYMTNRIFKSVMAARNSGINLAFLGSNTAYWQVRLSASPSGSDRRISIYRNPHTDPITSPDQISIQFNNPRINMLPSLITGETTAGVHVMGEMKVVDKPHWLNISTHAVLNGWSPNTEIDSSLTNDFSVPNQHIIFSGKFKLTRLSKASKIVDPHADKRNYLGQTTWFTTPSGSAVFVAGVNYWACELSYSCMEGNVNEETRSVLQSVTEQVLHLWQTKAIGKKLN